MKAKNRFGDALPRIVNKLDEAAEAREDYTHQHIQSTYEKIAKASMTARSSTVPQAANYQDHPSGGCPRDGAGSENQRLRRSYGRTHDHPNLWLAGAPTLPTGGCTNATMTFSALTLRGALTLSWRKVYKVEPGCEGSQLLSAFKRGHAAAGRKTAVEQANPGASDIACVVHIGFPGVRSPVDRAGDDAWHPLGHSIGSDDVEALGVTGLQQQVHVADCGAETGPGLPGVFNQLCVMDAIQHLAHGIDYGTGALVAAGGNPKFQMSAKGGGDLECCAGGSEQIFQCAGGAESADA